MAAVGNESIAASPIRADYPEPLWVQAVELISGEIAAGRLSAGMRLPPERELCEQLGISRVTLRKALTKLVADGVLSSSHGRGWYVMGAKRVKEWPNSLESFSETARRLGLTSSSTVLRAEAAPANLDEAEALAVAPGTPVFRLDRVRMLDAVPIAIDVSVTLVSVLDDPESVDFTVGSLYAQLERTGAEPQRADATIEAKEAPVSVASELEIAPGQPILVMRQIAFDSSDRAVSLSTISYVGDRYRLRTAFVRGAARVS